MEVKEKSKKRELIKTIAIIFLAVLLVLTFFSQTIMNHSLPEVATQLVTSGTINAKIRGSGTVAANENYEVVLNQTREIRSVCVKVGDKVEEGDLLFVLGDIESTELKEAQDALDAAQLAYQKQLLTFSKEYAAEDLGLKNDREDLERAIAERDANLVTDAEVSYAKGDLAAAETQLSQIDLILEELNAAAGESEEYQEAKAKVQELESEIKTLTGEVESWEQKLDELDTTGDVDKDRAVRDAETALQRAQTKWKGDWTAYASFINAMMEHVDIPWNYTSGTHEFTSDEQIAIDGKLLKWELDLGSTPDNDEGDKPANRTAEYTPNSNELSDWRKAYTTLLADQEDVAAKETALERARKDLSTASGSISDQRRTYQNNLDKAESSLATAERQLRDARQLLDSLSTASTQLKDQIKVYEASQRQQKAAVETLKKTVETLTARQETYKAAVKTVEEKQRALSDKLSGKDIDKQLDNLELQTLAQAIEKQRELVEKYRKDSVDTEVKARVSGVVSAVNVTAGKENTPNEAMAVIDVVDRGYTIKISVTSEQAKQVKVGDTADVTNYYWGSDITATLEQIAPDPTSPGQKKLLVFRITGEIDAGTSISLSIGQRSANFDTIVPKSALREDTNGHFVLVITSRSTPLGNRYTATRVEVQVLAEDDTNAAVSGLAANDYVITTSSKPLSAGTQVRMVENP